MLSFNTKTFDLVITIPEDQKKTALEDFKKINNRMASMVVYLENKDTPAADKKKFEPLYINLVHTVSQSFNILKAMGIPEQEIKKYCKF
jgi:Holliday junction resolvasome RuvABC DNA-binding subunit